MATFYYPVELRAPSVPRDRSFFFIEVDAANPLEASTIGSAEADAMLIAYKPTQVCKWWPVRMCPTVEQMLQLRADMDKARYGLPAKRAASKHARQMVPA